MPVGVGLVITAGLRRHQAHTGRLEELAVRAQGVPHHSLDDEDGEKRGDEAQLLRDERVLVEEGSLGMIDAARLSVACVT